MIREIIGSNRIQLELGDEVKINDVISKLIDKYPKLKDIILSENNLSKNIIVAINGTEIANNKLQDIKINPNDEVAILPPAGGGNINLPNCKI